MISRYIEIDGKPYVMELVSQLDENSLVDADGRNRLLKKLAGYNKDFIPMSLQVLIIEGTMKNS